MKFIQEFKEKHPQIEMGQRYFEKCKPFFVIPARLKDRNSCCCTAHVEIQMLFTSCMNYRKSLALDTDVVTFCDPRVTGGFLVPPPKSNQHFHAFG